MTIFCITDLSLALDGLQLNGEAESAAGGKQTGYLDLAKKGGGHKGNRFNSQLSTKKQNILLNYNNYNKLVAKLINNHHQKL